jgi:hypothetical protein
MALRCTAHPPWPYAINQSPPPFTRAATPSGRQVPASSCNLSPRIIYASLTRHGADASVHEPRDIRTTSTCRSSGARGPRHGTGRRPTSGVQVREEKDPRKSSAALCRLQTLFMQIKVTSPRHLPWFQLSTRRKYTEKRSCRSEREREREREREMNKNNAASA